MSSTWKIDNIPSQKGKNILITGANSGLGLEAATVLSQKEATVIMAVRNLAKGQQAVDTIKSKFPNAQIDLMQLDLADLESIHSFANAFRSKYNQLHILLNNAGVMWPPHREATKQGFESQFGINHLGHFALTGLLLELLKRTPNSRVVSQSSLAHTMISKINFDDLNWEKSFDKNKAYAQSKLANLLFTYELDRYFKGNNIQSLAVACHPGVTATNLFRSTNRFVNWASSLIGQKVEMGTLPMLRTATEKGLEGAEYFGPAGFMGMAGYPKQVKSTVTANDRDLAKRLWIASEELTKISYNFAQQ